MNKLLDPPKFQLCDDDRLEVEDCLRRSGYRMIRADLENFYMRVEDRISAFRFDVHRYHITPKSVERDHNGIHELVFQDKPPVGLLRARIRILPPRMFIPKNHYVEQAIESFYFPFGISRLRTGLYADKIELLKQLEIYRVAGFQAWTQTANYEILIHVTRQIFAGTTRIVRSRSRGHLVFRKLKVVQYSRIGVQYRIRGKLRPGRVTSMPDMIILIGALMHSWEILMGKFPLISRDDSKPFSQFVYLIFGLLGQPQNVRNALREFIKQMKQSGTETAA